MAVSTFLVLGSQIDMKKNEVSFPEKYMKNLFPKACYFHIAGSEVEDAVILRDQKAITILIDTN